MRAPVARHGQITVQEVGEPEPGRGQVLVQSLACGICGSDLHALGTEGQADLPLVYGHEFCAEIIDYGPSTEARFPVGTRVSSIPWATGPDGPELVGYSQRFPGGFAPRMVLDVDRLVAVPNDLDPDHAALAEPLAVGLHAVNRARLERDQPSVVIGCGPIGLAVIAALVAGGHGPVIASDFSAKRRKLAEQLGAHVVVDPTERSPHDTWEQFGVGPGVPSPMLGDDEIARRPVVFECVGVPGMLQGIIEAIPRHGLIVVVGVCMVPDQIFPALATDREVTLTFVMGYTPREFAESMARVATARVDVRPLVTRTVGPEGVADAFRQLAAPDAHAKILVHP
jgi:2-desacetyl-2-hydroxyethyl bacteriochlorophyllide A dehydrogenase